MRSQLRKDLGYREEDGFGALGPLGPLDPSKAEMARRSPSLCSVSSGGQSSHLLLLSVSHFPPPSPTLCCSQCHTSPHPLPPFARLSVSNSPGCVSCGILRFIHISYCPCLLTDAAACLLRWFVCVCGVCVCVVCLCVVCLCVVCVCVVCVRCVCLCVCELCVHVCVLLCLVLSSVTCYRPVGRTLPGR